MLGGGGEIACLWVCTRVGRCVRERMTEEEGDPSHGGSRVDRSMTVVLKRQKYTVRLRIPM